MTDQYLHSCICGNNWVSKKENAHCSQEGCYRSTVGKSVKLILSQLEKCEENQK